MSLAVVGILTWLFTWDGKIMGIWSFTWDGKFMGIWSFTWDGKFMGILTENPFTYYYIFSGLILYQNILPP